MKTVSRGRKGGGTKIHLALSETKVQGACLSGDLNVFLKLLKGADWRNINHLVADKGYDCTEVRIAIRKLGKTPVIPRKSNAIFPGVQDKVRYKTRSAIERFFGKIKENKRLIARFDKLDVTFFSFFAVACLKILDLLC